MFPFGMNYRKLFSNKVKFLFQYKSLHLSRYIVCRIQVSDSFLYFICLLFHDNVQCYKIYTLRRNS